MAIGVVAIGRVAANGLVRVAVGCWAEGEKGTIGWMHFVTLLSPPGRRGWRSYTVALQRCYVVTLVRYDFVT